MSALPEPRKDEWKDIAKPYMKLSQDPGTPPTKALLEKANQRWPFSQAVAIFDNGSGPGPVTNMLFNDYGATIASSATLRATDYSPAMVEQLQKLRQDRIEAKDKTSELWQRLETGILDAQVLQGVADESFSHVISGMMYMLVPDPSKALQATHRVLKPSGVLSLSCWETNEWMDMLRMVGVARFDSDNKQVPFLPPEWTSTAGVKGELEKAGFRDVECFQVPTKMGYETHEGIVDMFLTKIPQAAEITRKMNEAELNEKRQAMLALFKQKHPVAPGEMSGITLVAVGQK